MKLLNVLKEVISELTLTAGKAVPYKQKMPGYYSFEINGVQYVASFTDITGQIDEIPQDGSTFEISFKRELSDEEKASKDKHKLSYGDRGGKEDAISIYSTVKDIIGKELIGQKAPEYLVIDADKNNERYHRLYKNLVHANLPNNYEVYDDNLDTGKHNTIILKKVK
jgi:hypothetical protein